MSPSEATNQYGYCTVCGTLNNDLQQCNCSNKHLALSKSSAKKYQRLQARKNLIANIESKSSESVGPKYDTGKLRYDLVTPEVIKAIAEVLTFGAEKYAPNSWQLVPDAKRRYTAALMRHFEAYRSGEQLDPESGLSHLSHALCNLMFLQYFEKDLNENN